MKKIQFMLHCEINNKNATKHTSCKVVQWKTVLSWCFGK